MGLQINEEKSTFHSVGLEEVGLTPYKEIFSYRFESIETGFKYLGFFLKPNCYKADNWRWLINKFEQRINHWCNCCLSLGGQLVLIKAVLVSQPVYWISMVVVPISVLEKLRQLIYTFLWSGCRENKCLHLCNWDSIARPKKDGGWGIKKISFFNKSLAAKSLWC
jgi:hypothetical protein